ncbi:MAG: hypothetical protein JW982_08635 [Spirochaetes bacterium]|nr:hypothetical protein [Spirochaetota bacterium]
MGDDKKNIIVIKTKYEIPPLNSTGLMMLFVDLASKKFVKISTLTISGNHLYEVEIKERILKLVPIMIHGQDEYTVNRDYDVKIKNGMTTLLDQQNAEKIISAIMTKDAAVLDNFLKGNLRKIMSEDSLNVKFAIEQIGNSVLHYLQTIETLEHMTFAQKTDIVKKFNGGRKDLADKILKNGLNDIIIIKIYIPIPDKNIYTAVYFSLELKKIIKTDVAAVSEQGNISVKNTFVDYISCINDYKQDSDPGIEKTVNSILLSLVPDTIISVVKGALDEKATQFFKAVFNADFPAAKIEASVDYINSLFLYGMVDFSENGQGQDKSDSGSGIHLKAVDIKLVLSPSKGKNLLKLEPGEKIFVIPDKDTITGRKMIDQKKLEVDGKIKHLTASVYEIKKDSQNGYEVYVEFAPGQYGKSYEEQDVRIKYVESDAPEKDKKSKMSIVIGLVAGFFVIAATVVIILSVI